MYISLKKHIHLIKPLRSRPFALLLAGQTISSIGDGVFTIALSWQVLQLTNSATALGLLVTIQLVPQLLFLLLGGVAADRLPQRHIMLLADFGRAIFVALIAFLDRLDVLTLGYLIAFLIVFGLIRGFFTPAYQAILPSLVERELLQSSNALIGMSMQISALLGPTLGATLVVMGGTFLAFIFDGLTFIVSAFFLLFLHLPAPDRNFFQIPPEGQEWMGQTTQNRLEMDTSPPLIKMSPKKMLLPRQKVLADFHEGLRFVLKTKWLGVTILVASVVNIGITGSLFVALPKLVYNDHEAGIRLLGILSTSGAVGSLVAGLLMGQIIHIQRRGLFMYSSLIIANMALALFGIGYPESIAPVILTIAYFLLNICLGISGIHWVSLLQEIVPRDKIGRISSIDTFGSMCLLPIGYLFIGLIVDRVGPQLIFVGSSLLNILFIIVALCLPSIRRL